MRHTFSGHAVPRGSSPWQRPMHARRLRWDPFFMDGRGAGRHVGRASHPAPWLPGWLIVAVQRQSHDESSGRLRCHSDRRRVPSTPQPRKDHPHGSTRGPRSTAPPRTAGVDARVGSRQGHGYPQAHLHPRRRNLPRLLPQGPGRVHRHPCSAGSPHRIHLHLHRPRPWPDLLAQGAGRGLPHRGGPPQPSQGCPSFGPHVAEDGDTCDGCTVAAIEARSARSALKRRHQARR